MFDLLLQSCISFVCLCFLFVLCVDLILFFDAICISAAYAVMQCLSVCVCVCPTVTFVSCVKTNKHIIKIVLPSGSHAILVFLCQMA